MRRDQFAVIVMALTLGMLTACGPGKDTGVKTASSANGAATSSSTSTVTSDPATNGAATSSSTSTVTSDPATNGANEIGIDQPDLAKPIFSKQFTLQGSPQNKVTVGILSLERKDKILTLKVVATPEFADKSPGELIGFKTAVDSPPLWWWPTLLDLTNLKEYRVIAGSAGAFNYDDGAAVNGQPIYAWAVFAAPPADVTKMDLDFVSWMPRFKNVPIR